VPLSPRALSARNRRNVTKRYHGEGTPEFEAVDLAFRTISTEERVAEILAAAPPLSDDQRNRLAALLRGAFA
jgi:hypothetical protein